jgi:RNA polymerase sigma-70 factor (ECF subfamily)
MPALRGYANSLARHREDAEDLLQDGVLRMLGAADRFVPGSSFRAWAFTILRNRFLNDCVRRRARFVSLDAQEVPLAITIAVQSQRLELRDLHRQFAMLPAPAQRVLVLAAQGESSYLAIARQDGCAVGTVKSRVHRARAQLRDRLHAACH